MASFNAAYLVNSDPWGTTTNDQAMTAAFGAGKWNKFQYTASVFSSNYDFVFIDGSELNSAFPAFIADNVSLIQNWVAAGHHLFINAARNYDQGIDYALGFGVTLENHNYNFASFNVFASDPSNPIFTDPTSPTGLSWFGTYFAHDIVVGPLTPILTGNLQSGGTGTVLGSELWGAGEVLFGGMTATDFHSPQPEAFNLEVNILKYAATWGPLLPSGTDGTLTTDEDTAKVLTAADFGFQDADATKTLKSIRIDVVPSHGTLYLSGIAVTALTVISVLDIDAGFLTFVPALNENGVNYSSFQFSVNDGTYFAPTPNTLTFDVTPVNDAAIISGTVVGSVTEAGVLAGSPMATGTLTASDVDNPADTFTEVLTATASTFGYGTFMMTAGGVWTYTLDDTNPNVQALNDGQTLTDAFTVTSIDGTQQVITVTINGANDAALISGTVVGSVTEAGVMAGSPMATGSLTATDVDNPGNTFTEVLTATASTFGYGTFMMTAGGVWTYTLDDTNPNVQALNDGQTLTDAFTVTSIDGTQQVITVTINGANDAALISGTVIGSVTEAGVMAGSPMATGSLTATDVDNPANTFTEVLTATASTFGYGTFVMTAGGVWTYTLDDTNPNVQALNDGQTLTDAFTVTSIDGTQQVITVTINGANDAALLSADVVNLTETNLAADISTSGMLTITDIDSPTKFTVQAGTVGLYGTFAIDSAGAWTYTASSAHDEFVDGVTYTDTFDVTSVDGTHTSVTIKIMGTNDGAIISGVASGSVTEAGVVAGMPTATGLLMSTDADGAANTFTAVSTATASTFGYGTFVMTAGGVWTYTLDNTNATVQALNKNQTLTDTFTVTTGDGTAALIEVTINGTNDAAVISGTTSGSVTEAGGVANAIRGTPTATGKLTDIDIDNPSNLFTAVSAAKASNGGLGSFTMTSAGVWTYTLDNTNAAVQALAANQTLTDTFTVTSIDGTAQVITVTINGADDAAVVADFNANGISDFLWQTPMGRWQLGSWTGRASWVVALSIIPECLGR